MKRIMFITLLLAGCSHVPPSDEVLISSPQYVSFYEVQLVCPAAPQIGCGGAAKPLLLELEDQPGVREAWLNRQGTLVALVWEAATSRRQVLDAGRLTGGKALSRAADAQARADFIARTNNWHRAAEVDRLSEEEAEIIAARLVRRAGAWTPLPKDTATSLHRLIADTIRRGFLDPENNPREQLEARAKERARELLNEEQFAAFGQAYAAGLRPLANEP
jgi:hypothetical protein